eukprot:2470965-Rhodomonas_salina.1
MHSTSSSTAQQSREHKTRLKHRTRKQTGGAGVGVVALLRRRLSSSPLPHPLSPDSPLPSPLSPLVSCVLPPSLTHSLTHSLTPFLPSSLPACLPPPLAVWWAGATAAAKASPGALPHVPGSLRGLSPSLSVSPSLTHSTSVAVALPRQETRTGKVGPVRAQEKQACARVWGCGGAEG